MIVRLGFEEDVDEIVEMARDNAAATRAEHEFKEDIVRATYFRYIDTADPTIFVAEDKGRIVGFLVALICGYEFTDGLYTVQRVLYVRPDRRGGRTAALLMKHFIAWSEQLGAKEIIGGNDNSFNSEQTASFLEKFGFERVGYSLRRSLIHGRR